MIRKLIRAYCEKIVRPLLNHFQDTYGTSITYIPIADLRKGDADLSVEGKNGPKLGNYIIVDKKFEPDDWDLR